MRIWDNRSIAWAAVAALAGLCLAEAAIAAPKKPLKRTSAETKMPQPQACSTSEYLKPLEDFRNNKYSADKCKFNAPAECNTLAGDDAKKFRSKSICEGIYKSIEDRLAVYEADIKKRCETTNAKLEACVNAKVGEEQLGCIGRYYAQLSKDQFELADSLKALQEDLISLESKAKAARERYRESRRKFHSMMGGRTSETVASTVSSMLKRDEKCLALDATGRKPEIMFGRTLFEPSPLIKEQDTAITTGESFREKAYQVANSHEQKARAFSDQSAEFERRAAGASTYKPSNISGPTAAAAPTGGAPAGGAPGGGAPGGGSQNAGGEGAGGTGDLSNAPKSEAKKLAGGSSTEGNGEGGAKPVVAQVGKVEDVAEPLPLNTTPSSSGSAGSGDPSSTSASRAPASTNRASVAARAGSPGGDGGGGLGGSSSEGDKPCKGIDCHSPIGGLKSSQFASVGSLGGGMGSDGLGDSATLDSLFKTEGGPEAAGGLAGLGDAGADPMGAFAATEGAELQAGNEIGGSESHDLFLRVHFSYLRAQKRGNVVGIPKKL